MTDIVDLEKLENQLLESINNAGSEAALEEVRIGALGKKGAISSQMKGLGKLEPEQRKKAGQALNSIKVQIGDALARRRDVLKKLALEKRLATENVDVTLPARQRNQGTIHPVSQVWEEIVQIFADLGFSVAEGPHIDTDWYNFGALNIPPEHPARQEHDTFYFHPDADGNRKVLRPHTSTVQIRTMEKTAPAHSHHCPGPDISLRL